MTGAKNIVLATHNKDKAAEFQRLLADLDIAVVTLDSFPAVGEIAEDGETLEENALKKAREVHRITALPALADDTGLEVFYLNKAPGVYSARFAGPGATYRDNVKKLLRELLGVPERRRGAQFRCVLALVGWGPREITVEGISEGTILENPRGENGFGYDPIFQPRGLDQSFAEMDPDMKNSVSHRGRAARKMRDALALTPLK
jgi:XTP/dITP diphosphohydrolase